jgi:hypothetical protein
MTSVHVRLGAAVLALAAGIVAVAVLVEFARSILG